MASEVVVLRLRGEVDLAAVVAWGPRCSGLARRFPRHDVVVDLADVTFVDAAGLGLLVSLRADRVRCGGRFVVRNAGPRVVRLLELAGLGGVFPGAGTPWRREEEVGAVCLVLESLPPPPAGCVVWAVDS